LNYGEEFRDDKRSTYEKSVGNIFNEPPSAHHQLKQETDVGVTVFLIDEEKERRRIGLHPSFQKIRQSQSKAKKKNIKFAIYANPTEGISSHLF